MTDEDTQYYRGILGNEDSFYAAKYQHGEVIAGWDFHQWVKERTAGIIPFGTRNCYTALKH